jgi:hypothetical protein
MTTISCKIYSKGHRIDFTYIESILHESSLHVESFVVVKIEVTWLLTDIMLLFTSKL